MRARYVVLSLGLVMALGSAGISGAGEPEPNQNWFNSPVEGPSPNTEHLVGSTEDGECGVEVPAPESVESSGSAVLAGGGTFFPGDVFVELLQQGGSSFNPPVIQHYQADEEGHWGGPFPIPSGLDPGTYPLTATCFEREVVPQGVLGQGSVTLGGEGPLIFIYEDRFYIVVAPRDPADPVEAEVKLTG